MLKQEIEQENIYLKDKVKKLEEELENSVPKLVKRFCDALWLYELTKENSYSDKRIKSYSIRSIEEIFFEIWKLKQQALQNTDRDSIASMRQLFSILNDRLIKIENETDERRNT